VIATNIKNGKSASIQVKTRSIRNEQGWKMTNKADSKSTIKNHFYVFVNLKQDELPDYYIIPWNEFAETVVEKHKRWLAAKGRNGQLHKTTISEISSLIRVTLISTRPMRNSERSIKIVGTSWVFFDLGLNCL
jgi:hypothetical protein